MNWIDNKYSKYIVFILILTCCTIQKDITRPVTGPNYVRLEVVTDKYKLSYNESKLIAYHKDRDSYSKWHISANARVFLYKYDYKGFLKSDYR